MWGRGKSKYGAVESGGLASKLERAVYEKLLERERRGEISEVQRQQTVVLFEGPRERRITWRVDFSFKEGDLLCYAEAKGFPTEAYKLKLKIYRNLFTNPLEIWGGTWRNPKLVERIG